MTDEAVIRAAKVIQEQLDGDWTTSNTVAFMEYFGERAANALAAAGLLPAPRYWVGYYCPRGSGHYEIYGQPEYTPECGSKGWNVYLDAEEGDEYLPEGEWR